MFIYQLAWNQLVHMDNYFTNELEKIEAKGRNRSRSDQSLYIGFTATRNEIRAEMANRKKRAEKGEHVSYIANNL